MVFKEWRICILEIRRSSVCIHENWSEWPLGSQQAFGGGIYRLGQGMGGGRKIEREDICDPLEMETGMEKGGCHRCFTEKLGLTLGDWISRIRGRGDLYPPSCFTDWNGRCVLRVFLVELWAGVHQWVRGGRGWGKISGIYWRWVRVGGLREAAAGVLL